MDFTTRMFEEAKLLFTYFGYWTFALILGVFLLMLPIGFAYRKLFKKDSLQRLRKVVSALSVYVVSAGLISLFTAFVIKEPLTASYIFNTALPCGFLAQFLWAIFKFVRDYGFMPLLSKIAQSKEFANTLKSFGINEKIISIITDQVKHIDVSTLDEFIAKETEIATKLRTELNGFVGVENLENAVALCLIEIKSALPVKTATAKTDENVVA